MSDTPAPILTKILATIGPACRDPAVLVRLIEEGARVFRLNFSHGTFEEFKASLDAVREAEKRTQTPIGVLGDLSGPKHRLGQVDGGKFELAAGDQVEFTRKETLCRRFDSGVSVLSVNYPQLIDEVQPGHRVFIDDGNVRMLTIDRVWAADDADFRLHCRVTAGGMISNRKGVNLPDSAISAPSLTEWDKECAAWAVEHGVDFLALSFVRTAQDLRDLRALLKSLKKPKLPIVAKIEKPQAIAALEEIIDEADGIMVARGDLGVEMDLAEVPVLQKRIIQASHDYGKPVIVATQMLQSMIEAPVPTRAEASDVANAIVDGADAVMLSGETAVGAYPVQAVRTMARVAAITEGWWAEQRNGRVTPPKKARGSKYRTAAIAHGVSAVVNDLGAKWVVTWSELGGAARHLSQNRLSVPVIAASSNDAALRGMTLLFGVYPMKMDRPAGTDDFVRAVDTLLLALGWGEPGDAAVFAVGVPLGTPGVLNGLRIHYLSDVVRLTWRAKM